MWRRGVAALVAGVLVSGGVVPRAAADEMTQWYYDVMKIKAVHDQGYDGKGVKIALIDGKADLTMPELKGADATVKTFCNAGSVPEHEVHASNVLATMAAPVWGWAPKATYTVYASPVGAEGKRSNLPPECKKADSGFLLAQALNDKNDVVVVTTTAEFLVDPRWAYQLVRASERGVPVVVAAGNDGKSIRDAASDNLVIAAGAATREGLAWPLSNSGPQLTVLAPAADITIRNRAADGTWGGTSRTSGTSFAAPTVGAILGLGRQAHPKAHGNQLIRSLIANTDRSSEQHSPTVGHGIVNALRFLGANPVGEYETTPLMDKVPGAMPDQKMLSNYRDGIVDYLWMDVDNEFKFRGAEGVGCDQYPPERRACGTSPRLQSASPKPTRSTPSPAVRQTQDTGKPTWLWLAVGLSVVVLLGAAGVAWNVLRRSQK